MEDTLVRALNRWADMSAQEKIAKIRLVSDQKMPASRIAEQLNRKFDLSVTRNMVIGAISRAGLKLPDLAPKGTKPQTEEPLKGSIRFADTDEFTCKWPMSGDPGPDMWCCGEMAAQAKGEDLRHPYCEFHKALGTGRGTPSERRASQSDGHA